MDESFLTVFGFNIEGRPEREPFSKLKKDAYMIHIFTGATDYAMVTSTYNWTSYVSSLKGLARGDASAEFMTQRLIYNSLESLGSLGLFRMAGPERALGMKEGAAGGAGLDGKSVPTSATNSFSTDSCKLVDQSLGFSSTDLDSVTTSINSSTENLVIAKKCSGLEKGHGAESKELRAFGGEEAQELAEDPLLVSGLSNLGYWESAVVDLSDSLAISNLRKKSSGPAGAEHKGHAEKALDSQGPPGEQEPVREEEFYECREMKFDIRALKARLARGRAFGSGVLLWTEAEEAEHKGGRPGPERFLGRGFQQLEQDLPPDAARDGEHLLDEPGLALLHSLGGEQAGGVPGPQSGGEVRFVQDSDRYFERGRLDGSENALMNCNFFLKDRAGLRDLGERGLKYPLPRCVVQPRVGGLKEGSQEIFESDKRVWQTTAGGIVRELVTNLRRSPLYIYEANIAFSSKNKGEFGTYRTFRENVLPRISRAGYNCLLLTGLLEHYQSFNNSQYPFNYFVPYSKYGTMEEFKSLMDECHSRGIAVLTDYNLAFADITSSNSMLQPCDRETNNNLSNLQDVIEADEVNACSGSESGGANMSREESFAFGAGPGSRSDQLPRIDELFLDDSIVDLYESFMLTNLNTFNPSLFKHTPEVISSLFAYNKCYSRLNLGYIPMLAQVLSSLHYLMTQLGIDGFRFTVPDLSEEQDKYSCISSILALVNDTVHTIKPFAVTIANELLLRGNRDKACSELTVPLEYGGMGFDYSWSNSICDSLQGIVLKNPSSLNIKRDIIDELLPLEDKMRGSNKRIRILCKRRTKQGVRGAAGEDEDANTTRGSDLRTVEFVSRSLYGIESLEMKTVTQNPLRIAMFSWESLHTHLVGGVSPHVSELSASLVRLGHEVHLFTRATTSAYLIKVHDGVLYHECPFQLNSDFVTEITNMCNSFVYYMQRWEDGLTKVPDHPMLVNVKNGYMFNICHCHDWLAAPVLTSLRRIGNNKRTTIFTIHSTEYGRCGNQSFGGQSSRIADIEREGCHTADRLICVSGVLAEEVCRLFGVNRSKIKVIYNGIHCRTFDRVVMDDAGEVKRQYGIGPLEPTFLCVARMALQKGVDLLIEAVPSILKYRSDAKFIVVGDGHQKDEIVRRSHQLGIYNSVRFVGKKSGDDVIRLYKACDAVVVPSRNEPFGIVVLEGWTAGKPVVATTSGGPRDFLTPNVDGYLVEPCKDSIAWGCCEILKNFDHSRWMGSRGRVKAAYSFSWDSIAQITSFLYFEQCNVLDVAPSLILKPNSPIVLQTFGESALHHHMMVFDGFEKSVFALKQMKLLMLTMMAFAKNGVFQSMGSEFGNPDSFDLPRPNNDMDGSRMCSRWDLADNKSLKFKHLEFFNTFLIRLEKFLNWTAKSGPRDCDSLAPLMDESREGELGKSGFSSVFASKLTSPVIKSSHTPPEGSPGLALSKSMMARNQAVIRRLDEASGDSIMVDNDSVIYLDSTPNNGQESSKSIQDAFSRGKGAGGLGEDASGFLAAESLYNSSSDIKVILCHDMDKVMVVERNNCVFVFNYSDKHYSNYGFGISSESPQSLVIDTQDDRFGGDKKHHMSNNLGYSVRSEPGFKIADSSSEPCRISSVGGNGPFQKAYQQESPYRLVNTRSLRQTVFLDLSPFSAYVLAPSAVVEEFPCETIGDKVFSHSIDGFIDSLGLFC
ncbi:LPS glycosyltransferase [Cryptosporidium canis]|uniref:LPS glycosyltransferase n=1 Tax=Cryptosporidium canis TaxID=195482 RepID=A0ABQ8P4H0_9CRYT|nr:LPS glycosyltransferase [Cryptosporidium canis]